ncbi:MAG: hypothetical protein WBE88_05130, partial [Candidatus Acidiferrales bacterium]
LERAVEERVSACHRAEVDTAHYFLTFAGERSRANEEFRRSLALPLVQPRAADGHKHVPEITFDMGELHADLFLFALFFVYIHDHAFALFARVTVDQQQGLPMLDVRIQRKLPSVRAHLAGHRNMAKRKVLRCTAVNSDRNIQRQALAAAAFFFSAATGIFAGRSGWHAITSCWKLRLPI